MTAKFRAQTSAADGRVVDAAAPELLIEASCPECGAGFAVDPWARSHVCEFCASLLLWPRDSTDDAYVVSDGRDDPGRALEILVLREGEAYRGRLASRAHGDGTLASAASDFVERIERFRQRLAQELTLVECVDFFVPYRIFDAGVAQAILGRRRRGKEALLVLFQSQELERRYDCARFHLRDRGLKIRGFRLARLEARHVELAQGRFLPLHEPGEGGAARPLDRTRARVRGDLEVIARVSGSWRARELTVYKHLSYARVRRGPSSEHYLIDRQFGTVAARLGAAEAERYRTLEPSAREQLPAPGRVRAVASECPECGWELSLPEAERIHFCEHSRSELGVGDKGLEIRRYRSERVPTGGGAERVLWFPFWVVGLRAPAGAPSRLFVPARSVYGSPEADAAFALLTAHTSARQPELLRERPIPDAREHALGVDLEPREAAELARYALVAVQDARRTRSLNGRSFRRLIEGVETDAAAPELALVPLPLSGSRWCPSRGQAVAAELLRRAPELSRTTRSYPLRPRPRPRRSSC